MINVSVQDDFLYEDHCIRVLSVIDDVSLMIINKIVKYIGEEKCNLRIGILQVLCLQTLYKEEKTEIRRLIQ